VLVRVPLSIFGALLPLAMGMTTLNIYTQVGGAGANARFAIGLMIAAGMLVGTLFTLFVLPTFYLVMGGRRHRDLATAPVPRFATPGN
jgi:multidrug efflux pump subunit AcrB